MMNHEDLKRERRYESGWKWDNYQEKKGLNLECVETKRFNISDGWRKIKVRKKKEVKCNFPWLVTSFSFEYQIGHVVVQAIRNCGFPFVLSNIFLVPTIERHRPMKRVELHSNRKFRSLAKEKRRKFVEYFGFKYPRAEVAQKTIGDHWMRAEYPLFFSSISSKNCDLLVTFRGTFLTGC